MARQLGDSDAVARESARRLARSKEAHGRALNARGVGCETVPRVTLGIFEQARYEAMVAWEVTFMPVEVKEFSIRHKANNRTRYPPVSAKWY